MNGGGGGVKEISLLLSQHSGYTISSFSMYKNSEAIAIAGNTRPTRGTSREGK